MRSDPWPMVERRVGSGDQPPLGRAWRWAVWGAYGGALLGLLAAYQLVVLSRDRVAVSLEELLVLFLFIGVLVGSAVGGFGRCLWYFLRSLDGREDE